jgi:CheY-like chemotaxis protein
LLPSQLPIFPWCEGLAKRIVGIVTNTEDILETRDRQHIAPRVLLARLSPVAAVGMRRMLSEQGIEIVGEELRPLAIERLARELEPDVVVLALEAGGTRTLCDRIKLAAPNATVILWAAEENRMQILEPGETTPREVAGGDSAELRRELLCSQSRTTKE